MPKTADTHRIGDAVYELTLGLRLQSPDSEDVVGCWRGFYIVSRIVGLRAKNAVYSPVGVWPVRSRIPVEKMGQVKLDIPQAFQLVRGGKTCRLATYRRLPIALAVR